MFVLSKDLLNFKHTPVQNPGYPPVHGIIFVAPDFQILEY